jgi:hypothetical protein
MYLALLAQKSTFEKKKKVLTENKTTQNRPKQHRRKKDLPEPARLKTPKKENPKEREKQKTPTNSRNEAANHKRQPLHQSLKGVQKAPRPPRPKTPAPPAATPPRRPPPPSPPPRACTGASRNLLRLVIRTSETKEKVSTRKYPVANCGSDRVN